VVPPWWHHLGWTVCAEAAGAGRGPASIDDLVAATGRSFAEVRGVLGTLADLETDDQGRIAGYGLTCVPTVHRFEVNGR